MEIRIECIEGAERGRVFRFQDSTVLIGRSSRCDLSLDAHEELGVSGRHCLIEVGLSSATLEDCGSTNGTYLAGKPVTSKCELKDGATFRLGRQGPIFRFEMTPENAPTAAEKMVAPAAVPASADDGKWKALFLVSFVVSLVGGAYLYYLKFIA